MRTVVSFFILVSLVITLSPLLAYPAHLILENFVDYPFHKLVSHVTLICGLIFSGFYLKYHQMYSRQSFGFGGSKKKFLGNLLQGILAGILILALLNLFLLLFGVHQIKPNLDYFWSNLFLIIIKAILAGLVIGFIEESIFRGALFSSLYKKTGAVVTVSLTSLVYAAVHFLKYRALPEGTEITWVTGMEILPEAFFRFSDPNIIDHFLTLLVLGVLLSLIRIRNGKIAMCIGIHAGIVITMKVTGRFSDYMPGSQFDFLVNRYDHMLGYLSLAWLLVLATVYWRKFLFTRM
ncbi:MAG: CPBP family intramembrane glutamic endopeptidase [Gammaproteobacteria bacterium]